MAVLACVVLLASYAVAVRRPVPGWELDLTRWINDWPAEMSDALYPVMQLGTIAGPVLVAVAIGVFRRDLALSLTTLVAGAVTWLAAKGVKRLVDRGRPLEYLPDLIVRDGDGSGLGYLSGHAAVATSAAVIAMSVLPPGWRWVAAALAALVGIARIVVGVHLPADVIGGWSFGTLVALAALSILDAVEARRDR